MRSVLRRGQGVPSRRQSLVVVVEPARGVGGQVVQPNKSLERTLATGAATREPLAILLAISPIAGKPAVMRDGQYRDHRFRELVMDCVRESLQDAAMHAVLVARPDARAVGQIVDRFEDLGPKSVGRKLAARSIPPKGFANIGLGLGQDRDGEAGHSESRRALASLQGAGCVVPARSAARRRWISSRQVSEIVGSALPSRLSSSAITRADRSSAARASASSRIWSTRAFMLKSLAPGSGVGLARTNASRHDKSAWTLPAGMAGDFRD